MRNIHWLLASACAAFALLGQGVALAEDRLAFERPRPVVGAYQYHAPLYEVSAQRNLPIPMRDGVALAADLYRPSTLAGPLPTVLLMTPYGKHAPQLRQMAEFFAGQGFAFAIVDLRGKFQSEGVFELEHGYGADGYDTIQWMAAQAWSNQRVGMIGCSHPGQIQYNVARERPPALKALVAMFAGEGASEARFDGSNGARKGGALMLADAAPWLAEYMSTIDPRVRGWPASSTLDGAEFYDLGRRPADTDWQSVLRHLPLTDLMKQAHAPPNGWSDYLRPYEDPWWASTGMITHRDTVDVPAIHVGSWWDYGVASSIHYWKLFKQRASSASIADNQFLILAPTFHCEHEKATQAARAGELELGDARLDYFSLYLDWFRHWLVEPRPAGFDGLPKVRYFTTRLNRWRSASDWPLPGSATMKLYLGSDGDARTLRGNGRLSAVPPRRSGADSFIYDPAIPTPNVGGTTFLSGVSTVGRGARDQREREVRSDVLVYTSDVLRKPLEIGGPVRLHVKVSASVPDTDVHATLTEVEPNGRSLNVVSGILRLRHREGFDKPPTRMQPNQQYSAVVEMRETSHVFQAGSRLRIDIAGAAFPEFDRNLNTGGDNVTEVGWRPSVTTIHHSPRPDSYLQLTTPAEDKQ